MDIRGWPLDRIMQLPDNCFGRRWPIGLSAVLADENPVFDIAEAALPEWCVIWELSIQVSMVAATSVDFTLALGDKLPATQAEFAELELVFNTIISRTGLRGATETVVECRNKMTKIRVPTKASGRRFVGRFVRVTGASIGAQAIIAVSSLPNEVPDCLLSQKASYPL